MTEKKMLFVYSSVLQLNLWHTFRGGRAKMLIYSHLRKRTSQLLTVNIPGRLPQTQRHQTYTSPEEE